MNKRLKFEKQVGWAVGIEDKDALLGYFVSDTKYSINKVINNLEQIAKGEKTFEEIMQDSFDWTFGSGSGTFECDKSTAYFIADEDTDLPSMEMPLKELIELLYDWKTFLGK